MSARDPNQSIEEDDFNFSDADAGRRHYSPSKTGGQIGIQGLKPGEVLNADQADRDIAPPSGPNNAFDGITFTVFKRFIELISGEFQAVNKDIDMEKVVAGEPVKESHETQDTEIYEAQ